MDMVLEPKKILYRAVVTTDVEAIKNAGERAVQVAIRGDSQPSRWIMAGKPLKLETPEGPISLALNVKTFTVPFFLRLIDFRKVDYPGTDRPASFESDVVLTDNVNGLSLRRTIRMNEPLDYAGFRVFQSSYMQDAEAGEGSVFTVAKNPGILFIYCGAIIILLGVIMLFYLQPFFKWV